mmetsp:Transcript_29093/g.63214  ORF Transcript_29093/g.63214 Transcript_29093/m.63214 type:complete len:80 (+) Transcript_29093:1230-1469(+)
MPLGDAMKIQKSEFYQRLASSDAICSHMQPYAVIQMSEKSGARIFLVFPVQAREFAREAVHVGRLICPRRNHSRRHADV